MILGYLSIYDKCPFLLQKSRPPVYLIYTIYTLVTFFIYMSFFSARLSGHLKAITEAPWHGGQQIRTEPQQLAA